MRTVDFNKRRQQPATVQDVDLTARTAGNDTPPAYSFTPPAGQAEPDTAEDRKPEVSDYSYFSDLTRQYTEPPMTREEAERRSRSAAASQAVAGLGNVMSAFSNLAYAGTAPSQTLPQLPDADYQKLEDKAHEQRRQYNAMLYRGKAADYNAYQQALAQWNSRQAQKAELERKRQNDANGMLKWQYEQSYKAGRDKAKDAQADRDYRLRQQRLDEDRNYHKGRLEIEKSKGTGGKGKLLQEYPVLHLKGDNGRSKDYDMSKDADVLRLWGEYKKAGMFKGFEENEPDTPEKIRAYLMTRLGVRDQADSRKLEIRNPLEWGKKDNDKTDW